MLAFSHAGKRFGAVQALADCCFSVARGRTLGFLGPNGAGKTTAMRSVFGLVDLDEGEVLWDGQPIGLQRERPRARPVHGVGETFADAVEEAR